MSTQRLPQRMTAKRRETFLKCLNEGWTVSHAAQMAGMPRDRFYELRKADEGFAGEWTAALERGSEAIEDEITRRAKDGWWEEELDGEGNVKRRIQRYSPALLIALAKRRIPEYRDNPRIEATLNVEVKHRDGLTLADVAAFARTLDTVDGEADEVPLAEIEAA